MKLYHNHFFNSELSWLSFNHRVLQEAEESNNPLMERIKFLSIYSSNMDEFFRVRVASLRSLEALEKTTKSELFFNPRKILNIIHEEVTHQQLLFGEIFRNDIIPELKKVGVYLSRNEELNAKQTKKVEEYFNKKVKPWVDYQFFEKNNVPELRDSKLYYALRMRSSHIEHDQEDIYAVISISRENVPRFFSFKDGDKEIVMFRGDVLRVGLKFIFPAFEVLGCYSIKMSRDAELHIDDEFSGDLVAKIKEGLEKRKKGIPIRFLYDVRMPQDMLIFFKKQYKLTDLDLIPGGRYHSLNDFITFPNPDNKILSFVPIAPLKHPQMEGKNIRKVIAEKDIMLHFPYQSFDYVINWLEDASEDKHVSEIQITLYRVASESRIIQALIKAAKNKKKVTVFIEVKARFNEADNLLWADKMEKAGIKVLYSIPAIKVHCKLCLITRNEGDKIKRYAYFSTGNLNEKTANLYCDTALLTSDPRLTEEAFYIFFTLEQKLHVLQDDHAIPAFSHLMVAPNYLRSRTYDWIDFEIEEAKAGRKAHIIAKTNSLDDFGMIEKLYEASNAGVKIDLIVRGICCLIPDVMNQSKNIKIRSIIGRYLEHSRVFYYYHAGAEKVYLSSADWMRRNLDKRIEAAFPIYDPKLKKEILDILTLQLSDNVNARFINRKQSNVFVRPQKGDKVYDTHMDMYKLLAGDLKFTENEIRKIFP
ncbi:MAG: polyphosphate kinase 1 [Bacteroidia bacterium]|nr:polyphosphate kinase 1 [Bacteroidia bacterium]